MKKTTVLLLALLLALASVSCSAQSQTTTTTSTVATQSQTEASQTTTADKTVRVDPNFELVSWQMVHIPSDEYSDLEQREFVIELSASEQLPTEVALMLDLVFLDGEEPLLATESYFMDTSFAGLETFTVVVSCHNYLLDQAVLDSLADVDQINIDASVAYMSDPVSDDAPPTCQVVDKTQVSLVVDDWGIREDQLSLDYDNYPELGAAVLTLASSGDLLVVPMSQDYDDETIYTGYLVSELDWEDVEQVIICANADARPVS